MPTAMAGHALPGVPGGGLTAKLYGIFVMNGLDKLTAAREEEEQRGSYSLCCPMSRYNGTLALQQGPRELAGSPE